KRYVLWCRWRSHVDRRDNGRTCERSTYRTGNGSRANDDFKCLSILSDNAKISATSIVLMSCSTSFAFVPSLNIVRQNGQALEIIVGSTYISWYVRATFTRAPVVSSVHMRPPPAPQHIPFSLLRFISTSSRPGIDFKISLGGS